MHTINTNTEIPASFEYAALQEQAAHAQYALAVAQQRARRARVLAEQAAIAAAGSYKALGSNETERTMALEHALVADASYQEALMQVDSARFSADLADRQLASMRFAQRERDIAQRNPYLL